MAMHEQRAARVLQLPTVTDVVTDDLDQLLEVLPPHICDPLQALEDRRELLESGHGPGA